MPKYQEYQIIVDTPSQNAGLGFDNFANALAHTIESSRPRFAIGIFGPWGSGKTTLMQAIARKLNGQNTIAVEFSAWRYEKEEYLLIPLLDTVREALVIWAKAKTDSKAGVISAAATAMGAAAMTTASTIGRVIASLVAGMSLKVGLPGALEFSFAANDALAKAKELGAEQTQELNIQQQVARRANADFPQSVYHACFRHLKETFEKLRTTVQSQPGHTDLRFVVFVDDLDRCLPQGALEVLEAIKLFFEMEGFVFVVGLDRSIVERFVEQRYAEPQTWTVAQATDGMRAVPEKRAPLVSGAEYIKKIFQVPYNLAPVQISQLTDLINTIANDAALLPDQANDLQNRVQRHLRVLLGEVAVNPREVKRYINSYVLQMKVTPNLNPDVVLAVQTIRSRLDWKVVDDALIGYRDEFLTALRQDQQPGEAGNVEALDASLSNLPRSFLDYVRGVGDGRMLLDPAEIRRISEYLFSVESTGSTHGIVLLDVVRLLSRVQRELTRAPADKEVISKAQESLRNARAQLSKLESFPVIRTLGIEIDEFANSLVPTSPAASLSFGSDAPPVEKFQSQLASILQRLRALRRQDQIGSGNS